MKRPFDVHVSQVTQDTVEAVKLTPQDKVQSGTLEQIVGPKRVSEKIEEQVDVPVPEVAVRIVDVPAPQIRKATEEATECTPPEAISDCAVEHIVDTHVWQIREHTVEVVKVIPKERVQQHTEEWSVDMPVSQILEKVVEVIQLVPQEGLSDRTMEHIVAFSQFHGFQRKLLRGSRSFSKKECRMALLSKSSSPPSSRGQSHPSRALATARDAGPALFGLVTFSPSPTLFPQCVWSRIIVARPSFFNY